MREAEQLRCAALRWAGVPKALATALWPEAWDGGAAHHHGDGRGGVRGGRGRPAERRGVELVQDGVRAVHQAQCRAAAGRAQPQRGSRAPQRRRAARGETQPRSQSARVCTLWAARRGTGGRGVCQGIQGPQKRCVAPCRGCNSSWGSRAEKRPSCTRSSMMFRPGKPVQTASLGGGRE